MGWQTSGSTMNFEAVCRTRNPFAFKSTLSFDGEDRKERRKGTTPEKKREDAPFFLSSFPKPELVFNLCALCERKTKVGSPEKTIAGHILTQILNGLQCSCPIRLTDAMRSKYTKVKSVSVVKVTLQCSKCLSSIHDLRKQEWKGSRTVFTQLILSFSPCSNFQLSEWRDGVHMPLREKHEIVTTLAAFCANWGINSEGENIRIACTTIINLSGKTRRG